MEKSEQVGVVHPRIIACLAHFMQIRCPRAGVVLNWCMASLPVYSPDDMPLAWSILGSAAALRGLSTPTILRHLAEGKFDGEILGADEHGRSILSRWLMAVGTHNERRNRWGMYQQHEMELLRALMAHGADPWQKSNEGQDAFDLLFDHGVDTMLLELAPHDPAGPEGWKQRRAERKKVNLPWLHAVVQDERYAAVDVEALLLLPGADINQVDDLGNTPLFHAPNAEVVKHLLEKGADPSHRNHAGESVLSWWAGLRIPSAELTAMKDAVVRAGFSASRQQQEEDFREMAKTATAGVLLPMFTQLGLTERAAEFVSPAIDRILSHSAYSRQHIRTSWAWLDVLVHRHDTVEHLSPFDRARLTLLAHCAPQEEDSNSTNRRKLREKLEGSAPMTLPEAWDTYIGQREGDLPEFSHELQMVEYLRHRAALLAATQPDFADLWFRLTLQDDQAVRAHAKTVLPLVPWIKGQKETVDVAGHPRAWELLARSAERLQEEDLEKALEVLLQRNTPLPAGGVAYPASLPEQKRALMEHALCHLHTAPVSAPRKSLRF